MGSLTDPRLRYGAQPGVFALLSKTVDRWGTMTLVRFENDLDRGASLNGTGCLAAATTRTMIVCALTVVATCAVATNASASDGRSAGCEELWRQESSRALHGASGPDHQQLLATWLSHRDRCAGSVAWEARLAMAYAAAGKPDDARRVLAPLHGTTSPYAHLVDLASLQVDYFGLLGATITAERLEAVEKRFLAYVRSHPDVAEGWAQLGALQTALGKHADAVASLSKAMKSPMDLSGVYRNLTISYSALGRYADAVKVADEAVAVGPDMFVDPPFVYAAAKAFAAGGQVKAAVNALNIIATKRPDVRNDPDFWEAANFVKAKKDAAKR